MKKTATLFLLFSSFISLCFAQTSKGSLVANGATVQLVSSDFKFTEGPAADKQGNVYFTDQPNDKIMKWSVDGKISVFMDGTGRSNGMFFDNKGNLYTAADEKNQVLMIDRDKNVTVLVKDFEGKRLNGPNDLWIDKKGGIYFTDPFYKRDYWSHSEKEIAEENVYYLSPDRKTVTIAISGLTQPNGLIGTPDGKILYVADIGARKTYSYKINSDGTLSDQKLFAEMGSDGVTLDSKGNLYLTGRGITVFNPKGEKLETIPVDAPWTANLCFGGKDRKTLFITAGTSVYTLKMNVKGAY